MLEVAKLKDKVIREIIDEHKKKTKKKINFSLMSLKKEISIKTLSHPNAQIQVHQVNVTKNKKTEKIGVFRVNNDGKYIYVERME